jgi:hypothetical protein
VACREKSDIVLSVSVERSAVVEKFIVRLTAEHGWPGQET